MTDGTWKKLPSMKAPRACFQLVALGEYLFALGGLTPAGYTRSMERFEMMTEEWEFTAPLIDSLHRHAACITDKGKVEYKMFNISVETKIRSSSLEE